MALSNAFILPSSLGRATIYNRTRVQPVHVRFLLYVDMSKSMWLVQ